MEEMTIRLGLASDDLDRLEAMCIEQGNQFLKETNPPTKLVFWTKSNPAELIGEATLVNEEGTPKYKYDFSCSTL